MKSSRPIRTQSLVIFLVSLLLNASVTFAQKADPLTFAVSLSSEDMTILAQLRPPDVQAQLASDEKVRQQFAGHVRELFSLAEEARVAGLPRRPDIERKLALIHTLVFGEAYYRVANPTITDRDIAALFREPGQEARFRQFLEDGQTRRPQMTPAEVKAIRRQFALVVIAERRGIAAAFNKNRSVELRIVFEQAKVLSSAYASEILLPQINVSDAEIDEYLIKHATDGLTREKARDALQLQKERRSLEEISSRYLDRIHIPDAFTLQPPVKRQN